ncbi:hypothetical protein [uncultured Nocardioides sp.]|uniref:hypothetical protein n=1 Tax=uncultured Nocardioides sp. TaxID=198441 RepID=UPI0026204429|nr:hypothetical protein [uncultured Nocardioides sp.]
MPPPQSAAVPRRAVLALLLLAMVSAMLVGGGATAPAEAGTKAPKASESIRVDLTKPRFGPIDGWGIDLKQKCRFNKPKCRSRAQAFATNRKNIVERTFGGGRFSWIRVSFRADRRGLVDNPEQPNGRPTIDWSWYRPTIRAIQRIQAVDPSVRVWASRDTVTDCDPKPGNYRAMANPVDPRNPTTCPDFHPWMKVGERHGGKVIPARYGAIAADYVDYMQTRGVKIDVLGLDNEPHNNEGQLNPPRFLAAAQALRAQVTTPMPQLMMNDANKPDLRWLENADAGVLRHLTYATSHSHPKRRLRERAVAGRFAALARKRGLTPYNTEMHWESTPWPFDGVAQSLRSVFDQLDAGYRGFSIWAHIPEGTDDSGPRKNKARITNSLFASTFKAQLLRTTDFDGANTNDKRVTTRAFRRGRVVSLWIVNDRANGYAAKTLDLRNSRGRPQSPRSVSYKRWFVSKKGGIGQVSGRLGRSRGQVKVGVPAHSVTLVRIQL